MERRKALASLRTLTYNLTLDDQDPTNVQRVNLHGEIPLLTVSLILGFHLMSTLGLPPVRVSVPLVNSVSTSARLNIAFLLIPGLLARWVMGLLHMQKCFLPFFEKKDKKHLFLNRASSIFQTKNICFLSLFFSLCKSSIALN